MTTRRSESKSKNTKPVGRTMIDLTGMCVGRVKVIGFFGTRKRPCGSHCYMWLCLCHCGREFAVDGTCVRRGSATSCGCDKGLATKKHGMASRIHGEHWAYKIWQGMKQRCTNPNHKNYSDYGGRGIRICDAWMDSAEQFFADMGDRPSANHTIERIDNDGNYEPGNCRWASRAEQNENTRQTKLLTVNGQSLSISKWAMRMGVSRKLIRDRLRLGWSEERAVLTPGRKVTRNAGVRIEREERRMERRRR